MIIKSLSEEVATAQIVLFRNVFALVLLLPWVLNSKFSVLYTQRIGWHFLRASTGILGMACLYYSWGHLPLAQSALLKQTAPFFVPLFAFFLLSEKIGKTVIFSILIGFSGVYFVLNPQNGSVNVVVFIALFGAMFGAFAKVVVRKLSATEGTRAIVFYSSAFGSLIALFPAIFLWQEISVMSFFWLVLLAITSTIAQLLLSKAYSLTKAAVLAPFTYSSVLYAVIFGWLFWQEAIGFYTLLGITLIFSACLLTYRVNVIKKAIEE